MSFVDAVLRPISANRYIASRCLKSHMHTLFYEHCSFVDAVLRAISANRYIASRSLKSHVHTLIYEHRIVVLSFAS